MTHEAHKIELVGHSDLDGWGDAFQIAVRDGIAYVAASGDSGHEGTTVLDVRDPERPRVIARMPAPEGTHSHKTQLLDQYLIVNHEQMRNYDGDAFRPPTRATPPSSPRPAAASTGRSSMCPAAAPISPAATTRSRARCSGSSTSRTRCTLH
jgi:hypothetical protein